MMARRRLKDYLDDPSLLHTISEEEMIAWAAEVPYAGLVQRLLAQKLAIESANQDLSEKANTLAILSNTYPNHTIKSIEDFKLLILSGDGTDDLNTEVEESGKISMANPGSEVEQLGTGHSITDEPELADKRSAGDLIDSGEDQVNIEDREPKSRRHDGEDPKLDEIVENLSLSSEKSDFSQWLGSLQALEHDEILDHGHLELKEKTLASDALAQLLVSQGHYDRAIAMYEILMLKNPQKSSFFAAQIEKLKAL